MIKKIKILYLLLLSLLALGYSILIEFILNKSNINPIKGYVPKSFVDEIFIVLLVGPIVETFIFQFLVYYLLRIFYDSLKRLFPVVYILTSTLFFAIIHSYSKVYILYMLLPGALLAILFYVRKKKDQYPFESVLIVHLSYNIGAFCINHFI